MAKNNPPTPVNASPEPPKPDSEVQEDSLVEGQEAQTEEQPPSEEGQGQEAQAETENLGKFKDVGELAKSYQQLEAHTTRVSQELAETKRVLAELRYNQQTMQRQIPQQVEQPHEKTDWTDPDKAASSLIHRELAKAIPIIVNQVRQANAAQSLEAVRMQNPVEFDRRAQVMFEMSKQHPELNDDPAGAKKLFDMAGEHMEQASLMQSPEKLVETIAPLLAKKFGITKEQAKQALQEAHHFVEITQKLEKGAAGRSHGG